MAFTVSHKCCALAFFCALGLGLWMIAMSCCNKVEAPRLDDELFLFKSPISDKLDFALVRWIAGDERRHYPQTPIVVRLVHQALHSHHITHINLRHLLGSNVARGRVKEVSVVWAPNA